jgi:hypothetical protein
METSRFSFATLDALHAQFESMKVSKAEEANNLIREITLKFRALNMETVGVHWGSTVWVYDPKGERDPSEELIGGTVFYDQKIGKVMYKFEDDKPEVLAGLSAEIRANSIPILYKLIKEAESVLIENITKLKEATKAEKRLDTIHKGLGMLDAYRAEKGDDIHELYTGEEDEDSTLYKEPEDGGPCEADMRLTNEWNK